MATRPRWLDIPTKMNIEIQNRPTGLAADQIVSIVTVDFYRKRGFNVAKKYTELWQSGAWELRKSLKVNSQ